MSDKDISLNLQSLKYNIEADNKKVSLFIEEKVLSQRNIIDKMESWFDLNNKQSEFLAIVTVINSENKKHAVLLHSTKTDGEIQKITLIDPLSEESSTFKSEIANLTYLFHQQGTVVQIIYSGRQDKDYGTCGDISLIMLQELIENAINQKVIDDHLIASSLYNFESSMFHNFDYDNLQLVEAAGDVVSFY